MNSSMTDPAEELANSSELLTSANGGQASEIVVAEQFGVEVWSKQFYQTVFCLVDRADYIGIVLRTMNLSEDFLARAQAQIEAFKSAFSRSSMVQGWDQASGTRSILMRHTEPLRMLSPTIASRIVYPRLSDDQMKVLENELDELIKWLTSHTIEHGDFIKSAIIEGLTQFRFRLSRLRWLGWHYIAEPLSSVAGGALALDRLTDDPQAAPQAHAAIMKIAAFASSVYKATGKLVGATDRIDALVKVYSLVHMVGDGSSAVRAITHAVAAAT